MTRTAPTPLLAAKLTLPLALLATLTLTGCGMEATPPASSPPTDVVEHANAKPAASRRGELLGKWAPTLPNDEARAVSLTRFALTDPPNDQGFERLQPSAAERERYQNLIKLKTTEPGSPLFAGVKLKLTQYDAIRVELTPTTIGFGTPDGGMSHDPYTVVAETDDTVTISSGGERMDMRIVDHDHVIMRGATTNVPMTRDDPPGASVKDVAAPLGSRAGGAAAGGGAGKSGGAATPGPADACSAYADCIDQMPRLQGDQPIMSMSSKTIRGWERTPSRLKQCADTLEIARAGGLCR